MTELIASVTFHWNCRNMLVHTCLLVSGIIGGVLTQCPRSPSPLGVFGAVSNCEVECTLQCKATPDCFAYQFMEFSKFQIPNQVMESNCILQTAWDLDIISEELIDPNIYGFNRPKVHNLRQFKVKFLLSKLYFCVDLCGQTWFGCCK